MILENGPWIHEGGCKALVALDRVLGFRCVLVYDVMTHTSPLLDMSAMEQDEIGRLKERFAKEFGVSNEDGDLFLITASNVFLGDTQ